MAGLRGRNDDRAALGDWYADEQKYLSGLMPVINYVEISRYGVWYMD